MDITVYYKEEKNKKLFPKPMRALLIGGSGSGKTNLLLNLILKKEGISFKKLYVFAKGTSINQPEYTDLKKQYEAIESKTGTRIASFFSTCEDLISVDDCEPNSLVVFDDCIMAEQEKIKEYFIRSRHKRISCIYLSQNYARVDLQLIRDNVNFLCVFKQNEHYTHRLYDDFVGSDMTFNDFKNICKRCWDIDFGFITIDMTKKPHDGRYKCLFKERLNVNVNDNDERER